MPIRFNYVIPLFLIPVVGIFGTAIAPNEPVFLGRDWGIVASGVLAFTAFLLWIPYRAVKNSWSKQQAWFFALLVAAWLFQSVSTHLDQRTFNTAAILLPAAVIMLLTKRPKIQMLQQAFVFFLYGLVTISVAALILGSNGLMPDGFAGPDSGFSRIAILNDLFGIDSRWAGPFGSVNYAAPIGALLLVAGFSLSGTNRVIIVAGGLGVLVLSQGRTSVFAALFGLAVLVSYSRQVRLSRFATPIQVGFGILVLGVLFTYIAVLDPTLAGRTPIWSNFLVLHIQDPLFGIGTSGLEGYINRGLTGTDGILFSHGHNVLLDIAVRYGIFLVILTIAIMTIPSVISWRARNLDAGRSLALMVFVIAAGLAESIYDWQYLSVYAIVLIYVAAQSRARNMSPIHSPEFSSQG